MRGRRLQAWLPALLALPLVAGWARAADPDLAMQACRLQGLELGAMCGVLKRPLDPAAPGGRQIDLHFAVLPALARQAKPDPVFVFAGGPGQSAIELAGGLSRLLSRLQNRRDVVLIDQRGTGRSAPLKCPDPRATQPLRELADPARQLGRLQECRQALQALPHGDLRHYTTVIAMQDADAVRRALGAERINLVGASYGTRAVLDYQRQFPAAVRRAVIDGVAPPDMVLPSSFALDGQAIFSTVLAACEGDTACAARYPALRGDWRGFLQSLPRDVQVAHPVTGLQERLTLTRDTIASLLRQPLYAPALASALPQAMAAATTGRLEPLLGLSSALGGGRRLGALAEGMHFSVICAEDVPRMTDAPAGQAPDFGDGFGDIYRRVCADWPRGQVPGEFYRMVPAATPVLALSGGLDPATPPRHGERAVAALGSLARHAVVPNAGHGVLQLPCMRDVLFRFIDAEADADALQVDMACAQGVPRPAPFLPVGSP